MDGAALVAKIDTLLKQKNLKRQALAEYCEISAQAFSDWTRRGTLPSVCVAIRIASFFGVSIDWLFDDNYENQWNDYDDKTTTDGICLSPSGIIRRIEILIRQTKPTEIENLYELNEEFFACITDIINFDQIMAALENHYEPTIIQLFEIARKFNISLEWLISGYDKMAVLNADQYIFGIANTYSDFLKYYHSLPESDQKQIFDLVKHLFHSRREIRERLIDKNIDITDIPDLIH